MPTKAQINQAAVNIINGCPTEKDRKVWRQFGNHKAFLNRLESTCRTKITLASCQRSPDIVAEEYAAWLATNNRSTASVFTNGGNAGEKAKEALQSALRLFGHKCQLIEYDARKMRPTGRIYAV